MGISGMEHLRVLFNSLFGRKSRRLGGGSKIYNYGMVTPYIRRGSYPDKSGIQHLVECGVTTFLDLSDEECSYREYLPESCTYINIPLSDKSSPSKYSVASLEGILDSIHDNRVSLYVHCRGGRHRTGVFVAMFRYRWGWTFSEAYNEMRQYDFYTAWGHKPLLEFIKDYYERKS